MNAEKWYFDVKALSLPKSCPGQPKAFSWWWKERLTAVCKTFQWRRRPLEDSYLYCFISIMVLLSTSISWIGQPYSIPPLPFGIWSCPISRGNYEGLDLLPYSCRLELPPFFNLSMLLRGLRLATYGPLASCCPRLATYGPSLTMYVWRYVAKTW